jgi:hypothetical protein
MAQLTTNTTAFIEAEQYSKFILENLDSYRLPDGMWRDVSDFGHGTTLNIKTVGDVTIQDAAEDTPLTFNPIDTGNVTLQITDYRGDAWYISDELREDGSQIDQLSGARAMASTRAFAENLETRFLTIGNAAQTLTNVNLINGRPHRWIAGGAGITTRIMSLADFIAAKLAADKANAPPEGRIAIVDPIVEATLNSLTNLVNVSNNPHFEGIVTEGFVRTHKFIRNIYGWDVWTSNFLPTKTATEAINASSYQLANTTAQIGDIVNQFMCVADDNCKPIMHAWRRQPRTEGWRDPDLRADKFQVTSRFGFGAQRLDTFIAIITSGSAY